MRWSPVSPRAAARRRMPGRSITGPISQHLRWRGRRAAQRRQAVDNTARRQALWNRLFLPPGCCSAAAAGAAGVGDAHCGAAAVAHVDPRVVNLERGERIERRHARWLRLVDSGLLGLGRSIPRQSIRSSKRLLRCGRVGLCRRCMVVLLLLIHHIGRLLDWWWKHGRMLNAPLVTGLKIVERPSARCST